MNLPDGTELYRFRNQWGDVAWIPADGVSPGLDVSQPLVSRELIQGRAVAVFWPLKPHKKLWRLGWLH